MTGHGGHEVRSRGRSSVRWLALFAFGVTGLALCSCGGCATLIVPPLPPADPVAVYVADYGRHSSIILPRSDEVLVEYTYGEWQWFALNEGGPFGVVRALLLPSRGALGRRNLDRRGAAPWWEELRLVNAYEVIVERERVESLLTTLDERWEEAAETRVYNRVHDLDFVFDRHSYTVLNNSNPTTANWLRELGCEVRGPALLSKWKVVER